MTTKRGGSPRNTKRARRAARRKSSAAALRVWRAALAAERSELYGLRWESVYERAPRYGRRRWTDERDRDLVEAWDAGVGLADLARLTERPMESVRRRLAVLGCDVPARAQELRPTCSPAEGAVTRERARAMIAAVLASSIADGVPTCGRIVSLWAESPADPSAAAGPSWSDVFAVADLRGLASALEIEAERSECYAPAGVGEESPDYVTTGPVARRMTLRPPRDRCMVALEHAADARRDALRADDDAHRRVSIVLARAFVRYAAECGPRGAAVLACCEEAPEWEIVHAYTREDF